MILLVNYDDYSRCYQIRSIDQQAFQDNWEIIADNWTMKFYEDKEDVIKNLYHNAKNGIKDKALLEKMLVNCKDELLNFNNRANFLFDCETSEIFVV